MLLGGMKLEITLASGIRLAFDGEREDFDHMAELLNLTEVIGSGFQGTPQLPPPREKLSKNDGGDIDIHALSERLTRVGADKHTERLTVMAWAAVEAGKDGLDYPTAESLYRGIGERKPGNWKSAFSNARTAGLLQGVSRGLYKPTTKGENFALYGPEASGSKRGVGGRHGRKDADSQSGGETD